MSILSKLNAITGKNADDIEEAVGNLGDVVGGPFIIHATNDGPQYSMEEPFDEIWEHRFNSILTIGDNLFFHLRAVYDSEVSQALMFERIDLTKYSEIQITVLQMNVYGKNDGTAGGSLTSWWANLAQVTS